MTFILRSISHTADGREILRARTVEKPLLIVGRAAESDIPLQDLAVDPSHARIVRVADRRIEVSAIGSLGFEQDGRPVMKAEIDTVEGAELKFGGHRLTVSHDSETGAVAITIQRVESLSHAAQEKDEAQVFSLTGTMLSKRGMAWALVAAVLVGFLMLPILGYLGGGEGERSIYGFKPDKSWSSGKLSEAHHALEGKCETCHVKAFVAVRDSACLTCHKDVHDHAPPAMEASARGAGSLGDRFLASVAGAFGKPEHGCVDCHTEHEGAGRMPPTPQAFCADCHGALKERLPRTQLADASDFGRAHPEFRPLVSVRPGSAPRFERLSLAGHPRDDNGLKFTHALHLSRTGGVARMAQTMGGQYGFGDALACKDCHTPTADGVRFQPVEMERDCAMCHSLAFDRQGGTVRTLRHGDPRQVAAEIRSLYAAGGPRPPMLDGMARRRPGQYAAGHVYNVDFGGGDAGRAEAAVRAVFSPGGACFDCHGVKPPGASGVSEWTILPVHQPMRYMMKGWFSHEAHAQEKCESCHNAGASRSAADLMLPDLASCRQCHGGEASSAKVPSTCALCHSYHARPGAPWVSALRVVRSRTGSDLLKARAVAQ